MDKQCILYISLVFDSWIADYMPSNCHVLGQGFTESELNFLYLVNWYEQQMQDHGNPRNGECMHLSVPDESEIYTSQQGHMSLVTAHAPIEITLVLLCLVVF